VPRSQRKFHAWEGQGGNDPPEARAFDRGERGQNRRTYPHVPGSGNSRGWMSSGLNAGQASRHRAARNARNDSTVQRREGGNDRASRDHYAALLQDRLHRRCLRGPRRPLNLGSAEWSAARLHPCERPGVASERLGGRVEPLGAPTHEGGGIHPQCALGSERAQRLPLQLLEATACGELRFPTSARRVRRTATCYRAVPLAADGNWEFLRGSKKSRT
jgi:hypothetical protein